MDIVNAFNAAVLGAAAALAGYASAEDSTEPLNTLHLDFDAINRIAGIENENTAENTAETTAETAAADTEKNSVKNVYNYAAENIIGSLPYRAASYSAAAAPSVLNYYSHNNVTGITGSLTDNLISIPKSGLSGSTSTVLNSKSDNYNYLNNNLNSLYNNLSGCSNDFFTAGFNSQSCAAYINAGGNASAVYNTAENNSADAAESAYYAVPTAVLAGGDGASYGINSLFVRYAGESSAEYGGGSGDCSSYCVNASDISSSALYGSVNSYGGCNSQSKNAYAHKNYVSAENPYFGGIYSSANNVFDGGSALSQSTCSRSEECVNTFGGEYRTSQRYFAENAFADFFENAEYNDNAQSSVPYDLCAACGGSRDYGYNAFLNTANYGGAAYDGTYNYADYGGVEKNKYEYGDILREKEETNNYSSMGGSFSINMGGITQNITNSTDAADIMDTLVESLRKGLCGCGMGVTY